MLLEDLKSLLKKYNLWAKKRLGQNFLIDEQVLCSIIEAAELKKSDNIIEVGPGTGFLTDKLLEKAGNVVAIEQDKDMVRILNERFDEVNNLKVVNADVLKTRSQNSGFRSQTYKVVANIPYYITSPLLKHFLQSDNRPEMMVLLVQKEVAEKICGISGKSVITIETQIFGEPEIIEFVPSNAFYPAPKVNSAILRIRVYKSPLVPVDGLRDFLRIVKFGFSQKRKKLKSSLAAGLRMKSSEIKEILIKTGIDPDLRAENLSIENWQKLAKALTKLKK